MLFASFPHQFIRRDAHLFWRRSRGSVGKVQRSLWVCMKVYWCVENGRCHLGVLAQLAAAAAAAAWTHDVWAVWLCERPCVLFRGEGRCSSSGFKINQSGMWPLGPKGFIHTDRGTSPLLSAFLSHPRMNHAVSCTIMQPYLPGRLTWHEQPVCFFFLSMFCASSFSLPSHLNL